MISRYATGRWTWRRVGRCFAPSRAAHSGSDRPAPVDTEQGQLGNKQILKVLGVSFSLEVLFGVSCAFGMAYYCLGTGGEESAAAAAEAQQRDDAWRCQAAELKAFYDAQQGVEQKIDPPEGTDLARFAMSNRRLYRMHFGLAAWKIRELESIVGWRWRIMK
eukprot:TRINITY_DN38202_c0_g1_i1.p1 TRINITY_DN38202_c0_g1~~TRINITY_DN38202_c0_g1_i1.p1  ORF type:complete len:180 (+),score=30.12 TRINITY_DN38202_c0_g1_i1:57-542(+)